MTGSKWCALAQFARTQQRWFAPAVIGFVALLGFAGAAHAERISDIRNTKHNFSATVLPDLPGDATRQAYATSESQICAFCHTPHGANLEAKTPLWNRQLSTATYTPYSSTSIDAVDLAQPGGKSKLCLSCHDGTIALGSVNVLNRVEKPDIDFTGPGIDADDKIPEGQGERTGYTRRLGVDLTNDHPISFTFDSAQAQRDGELYDPAVAAHLGTRRAGFKPRIPLEDNKVECVSCHDPHVRDTSGENIKFLRVNRFQQDAPVDKQFNAESDIICLGCHDKAGWVGSAHANPLVATYQYANESADLREFPRGMQVWQAACLNCHDPHAVQGTRRILREGVDGSIGTTASGARFKFGGGSAAIEQTCYACHSAAGADTLGPVLQGQANRPGFGVPDIHSDFQKDYHMPLASADQAAQRETHSIGTSEYSQDGKDFVEAQANLGKSSRVNDQGDPGTLDNRHAECTDCHNPHRVARNRLFWQDNTVPDVEEGTHPHSESDIAANNPEGFHTNVASGVLRGIFGVEPVAWESTEFGAKPTLFEVKRGDPGAGGSTDSNASYVTREYQVCLKCHSTYAYDTPPPLSGGLSTGGTPQGEPGVTEPTNPSVAPGSSPTSMSHYTNQGMEYQSPEDHKGEGTSPTPSGAYRGIAPQGSGYTVDFQANNHRSWHPVLNNTGRTPGVRNIASPNVWRTPFNMAVGLQTMYCTDCHGNDTEPGTVVPTGGAQGNVWGPHGSENPFLLKGDWGDFTGSNDGGANREGDLCFKCHNYDQYGNQYPTLAPNQLPGGVLQSGFKQVFNNAGSCIGPAVGVNAHVGHGQRLYTPNQRPLRCTYCHINIPHGWKNKVFLANLNDVGLEGGLPSGTQVRANAQNLRYYNYPYYNGAVLKVKSFARSGEWIATNCGSAGFPGNGKVGVEWMQGSTESCDNIP